MLPGNLTVTMRLQEVTVARKQTAGFTLKCDTIINLTLSNSFCFLRAKVYPKLIKWCSNYLVTRHHFTQGHKNNKKARRWLICHQHRLIDRRFLQICRAATPQQLSISQKGENQVEEEEGEKNKTKL